MKKKKKIKRLPDYKQVDLGVVTFTFGTSVYLRKDGQAIAIIFPCGEILHFRPNEGGLAK